MCTFCTVIYTKNTIPGIEPIGFFIDKANRINDQGFFKRWECKTNAEGSKMNQFKKEEDMIN